MEVWHWEKWIEILKPALTSHSNIRPIAPQLRLARTLKYIAHGGSIQSVAWSYRISRTTARKIISETYSAIWNLLADNYVKVPTSPEEWRKIASSFWELWNFPNCSKRDGGIFAASGFGKAILQDKLGLPNMFLPGTNLTASHWFVANEAFPLKGGKLSGAPDAVEKLIIATDCLPNFIMTINQKEASRYCPEKFVDYEENATPKVRKIEISQPHLDLLANYFVEEGEVPWHYEYINRRWASN
ncbi:hypothetical protein PR048_001224 [Dryococelus australis]|uniref:Uncharacterized protein n=1 Tax=Dryococelus australis TaxID=614101 RepID=A0ABQ9II42_9NEOP|nr:hypothetical protein PR048_001224 [Dryococelus australis]